MLGQTRSRQTSWHNYISRTHPLGPLYIWAMHLVYIDDSRDLVRACFAALLVPADSWNEALNHLQAVRKAMRESDGIYLRPEMHATKWLAGKGEVAPYPIRVPDRVRLYNYFLSTICAVPGVRLMTASTALADEITVFERLLNRINTNMQRSSSKAVIFSDEGKNYDGLLRGLRRYNPIPSKYGAWEDGKPYKNMPLDRILEDLVYRDSKRSLFVQAADCCAYAVLRREHPLPSKTALGLDQSFYILAPIMVRTANHSDQYGVVR